MNGHGGVNCNGLGITQEYFPTINPRDDGDVITCETGQPASVMDGNNAASSSNESKSPESNLTNNRLLQFCDIVLKYANYPQAFGKTELGGGSIGELCEQVPAEESQALIAKRKYKKRAHRARNSTNKSIINTSNVEENSNSNATCKDTPVVNESKSKPAVNRRRRTAQSNNKNKTQAKIVEQKETECLAQETNDNDKVDGDVNSLNSSFENYPDIRIRKYEIFEVDEEIEGNGLAANENKIDLTKEVNVEQMNHDHDHLSDLDSEALEANGWSLEDVTCFCLKAWKGRRMIQCDFCDRWIHFKCAKLNRTPNDYYCADCRRTRKRSSRKSSGNFECDSSTSSLLPALPLAEFTKKAAPNTTRGQHTPIANNNSNSRSSIARTRGNKQNVGNIKEEPDLELISSGIDQQELNAIGNIKKARNSGKSSSTGKKRGSSRKNLAAKVKKEPHEFSHEVKKDQTASGKAKRSIININQGEPTKKRRRSGNSVKSTGSTNSESAKKKKNQGRKVKTELDSREIDADLAAISNVGKNSYFDISEASTSSGISSTSMKPPLIMKIKMDYGSNPNDVSYVIDHNENEMFQAKRPKRKCLVSPESSLLTPQKVEIASKVELERCPLIAGMIDVGETTVHLSLPDKKRRYSVVSNKSNSSVKSDFGNASGKQKAKKKQTSRNADYKKPRKHTRTELVRSLSSMPVLEDQRLPHMLKRTQDADTDTEKYYNSDINFDGPMALPSYEGASSSNYEGSVWPVWRSHSKHSWSSAVY